MFTAHFQQNTVSLRHIAVNDILIARKMVEGIFFNAP
jgi:hypothetical protein